MLSGILSQNARKSKQDSVAQLFDQQITIVNKHIEVEEQEQDAPQDDQPTKEQIEEDRKYRTVFVGNVEISTKAIDITKLFKKYGEIEKVWFRSIPVQRNKATGSRIPIKAAIIMEKYLDGAKSKNCYVLFQEIDAAKEATREMDGQVFKDLHLRCTLLTYKKHDHSKTAFVGNLPFNIEEEQLRTEFEQFGPVQYVRVIRDKFTHQGKGFGYVSFKEFASLKKALTKATVVIAERPVRITKAQPDVALNKGKGREDKSENLTGATRRLQNKKKIEQGQKIKKTIKKLRRKNANPAEIKESIKTIRTKAKAANKPIRDSNIFNQG